MDKFVTTYARYDSTGDLVELRGFIYSGPVALCGGPSAQQEALAGEQANFYQALTQNYQTMFGEQQSILNNLNIAFDPILAAGPNQYGFNTQEQQGLTSAATQGTGQAYGTASTALQQALNARGGNIFIPSGENTQLQAQVAENAANQQSSEMLGITNEGYQVGRENFLAAAQQLSNNAGLESPVSYASAANQGGQAAYSSAAENTQMGDQWMGLLGGVLGGAATGLAGGFGGQWAKSVFNS